MTINAREGYILTNGDVYGYTIALGSKDSETNYHEITIEEYKEILKQREEAMCDDLPK